MCESQASKDWRESIHKVIAEPTPTPSITVGTQVRLTGVVTSAPSERDGAVAVRIGGAAGPADTVFVFPEALEVIRQPFKRGEVVYYKIAATNETPFVVLNDENLGFVDVTNCATGFHIPNDNAGAYERRPSRPKEER